MRSYEWSWPSAWYVFRVFFIGFISIDPISSSNWLGCSKKLTWEQCSVQSRLGLIIRDYVSNIYIYPLVNVHITMERSSMLLMGTSTISMAIFNSFLYVYQVGYININRYVGEYHNAQDETGRAAAELGKRIAGFPGTLTWDEKTVVLATVQLGLIMDNMLVDRLIDRAFFWKKNGSNGLKSLMGFVFFLCFFS